MTYEIQKEVPIKRLPRSREYPFAQMEVGDSFEVTEHLPGARSSAHQFGVRHGMLFATRKTKAGLRIWRTK